ncbi:hypothetical protein [Nocardioides cremeus]|jgi:hypothetical protein|uniref:Uncharacterized protein n=1 Tax=Nocardioides cremeus TaxID=3058044 RepID=A0ABT8TRR7_9ACTN|nr:hypothetical protein [Nocardioides cremeus]MDO3396664.1 hypothetical protein [Nocardioides cremeus]
MNLAQLPELPVTDRDLDLLDILAPLCSGRFSCNGRTIWPTDHWGWSHPSTRRTLDVECELLELLRRLMIRIDSRGGRMLLSLEHGYAFHLASRLPMARLVVSGVA